MDRNRTMKPALPFIFIHEAESFVVTDTPAPITWGHVLYGTSDFHHSDGDTKVVVRRGIDTEGIYEIFAMAGAVKKAGNPTELVLELYVNGVAIPCCQAHASVGAGVQHSDAVLITAKFLHIGDYIEVYVSVDDGSATIENVTARLMMQALQMRGWNNNNAGNLRVRGDVIN